MKTKDSVIILSGGMDSVTLLHDRKEQIALAVTFDYGKRLQGWSAIALLDCSCRSGSQGILCRCSRTLSEAMLSDALGGDALGFAIVMRGKHLCKSMRGVRNDGNMSVAHFTGLFDKNPALKAEFYKLIDLQER